MSGSPLPRPSSPALIAFATCLLLATGGVRADLLVPDDYATIAAALAAIQSGSTTERVVTLAPGTYTEAVTLGAELPSGVTLRGRETARTILSGTITTSNAADVRISNLSFTGSGPAVRINGGNVTVANNVFRLAGDATAITIAFSTPEIRNNVFSGGGVAIDAGGNACLVENNAFIETAETLVAAGVGSTVDANAFHGVAGVGTNPVFGDPLFVDAGRGDFHLREDSPLIDAGVGNDALDDSVSDIGAYGGEHADGVPFPVRDLAITASDSVGLDHSVSLQWNANLWYRLGGYRVHYDIDGGEPYAGTGADQGDSPADAGDETTFTITGLAAASAEALTPPVLEPPVPGDRQLRLRWSATPGASGYLVSYGVDGSADAATTIDVGNVTAHTLGGLVNDTDYRIEVSAYAQRRYHFAVTAYPAFNAGIQSMFSDEVSVEVGERAISLPSNAVIDFPETVRAFPDLPDRNGCFIATAAFGHYGADEVRLLRRFRDDYLLTHAPGRAFVSWYYRHSPAWVEQLRAHEALLPLARLALLPLIGVATFALHAPLAVKWGLAVICLLAVAAALRRRAMIITGDTV